jgi:hypothetical protein
VFARTSKTGRNINLYAHCAASGPASTKETHSHPFSPDEDNVFAMVVFVHPESRCIEALAVPVDQEHGASDPGRNQMKLLDLRGFSLVGSWE